MNASMEEMIKGCLCFADEVASRLSWVRYGSCGEAEGFSQGESQGQDERPASLYAECCLLSAWRLTRAGIDEFASAANKHLRTGVDMDGTCDF